MEKKTSVKDIIKNIGKSNEEVKDKVIENIRKINEV
jgi:hypothetical protein